MYLKNKNFDRVILIIALLLICLSTGLRIYLSLSNGHALNDRVHLIELADNLYKGRGFVVEWINFPAFHWESLVHPDPYKHPLYPFIVSLVFRVINKSSIQAANLVTAFFASLSVILVYLIGDKLFNRLIGLISLAVILTNRLFWRMSINAQDQPIYGFFLISSFYLLILALENPRKTKHWLLLGVSAGLVWLARPDATIALPTYLAIILFFYARKKGKFSDINLRRILVFVLISILVASPFLVRNLILFDTPFFGGYKLFRYHYYSPIQKNEKIFFMEFPSKEEYWATHSIYDFLFTKVKNFSDLLGQLFLAVHPVLGLFMVMGFIVTYREDKLFYLFSIYLLVYILANVSTTQHLVTLSGSFVQNTGFIPILSILIGVGIYHTSAYIPDVKSFLDLKNKKEESILLSIFLIVLLLTSISTFNPKQTIEIIRYEIERNSGNDEGVPRVKAARWLEENTLSSDVIMSRKVDIHYYSGHRKVVMIPFGPVSDIEYMVERYNVTYIMVLPNTFLLRPSLKEYVENKDLQEVYNEEGVRILKVM